MSGVETYKQCCELKTDELVTIKIYFLMGPPVVFLINPWIHDFAAYDLWVKPLGLLLIAGLLKENGFKAYLIDCLDSKKSDIKKLSGIKPPARSKTGRGQFYKEEIDKPYVLKDTDRKYSRYGVMPSQFDNELASLPRPDAVLVTSIMTYWYPGVFEVIKKVKSKYPDVPVLLGGLYVTLRKDHERRFSGADKIFSTYDISAVLEYLCDLTGKKNHAFTDNRFLQPDCELICSKKSIPILSSRGCPFKCSYCASGYLYPYFKQNDPIATVNQIEYWSEKEAVKDFVFFDDALLVNPDRHFIPMMNEILKRDLSIRLHAPNGLHVRNINHETAELMMKAGFRTLRLGFETSSPSLQETTGGKVTTQEFICAAGILKEAGFGPKEVGVYLLAGLPEQKFESVYDSIRFVQDCGLRPYVAEYSPIPGTTMWKNAVKCSCFPLEQEPLFHNNTLLPCRWKGFTPENLNFLKIESRKTVNA